LEFDFPKVWNLTPKEWKSATVTEECKFFIFFNSGSILENCDTKEVLQRNHQMPLVPHYPDSVIFNNSIGIITLLLRKYYT